MPLYEYECENGHRFEKIQKFSDPPLETCPTCGAPVRKLMSSPAIQFKGSGWYITDYAKKDSTSAGAASGTDTKSDNKFDKKPSASGESGSSSSGSDTKSTPAPSTTKSD